MATVPADTVASMVPGTESDRTLRGRYRLLELVGTGANARVYTAEDLTLRRRVAVKILREELAADEAFRQCFEQEMRAAAALSLPRLLPVYDWGLEPVPHVVTEHLTGGSFADMLAAEHRLTLSQALSVGLEVARALVNIHRAGRAYCGLAASSIIFDSQARVFVSDLGVSAAVAAASKTSPDGGDGRAAIGTQQAQTGSANLGTDPGDRDSPGKTVDPVETPDRVEADDSREATDAFEGDGSGEATDPADANDPSDPGVAAGSDSDDRVADSGDTDSDPAASLDLDSGFGAWNADDDAWDTEVWDVETWGLDEEAGAGNDADVFQDPRSDLADHDGSADAAPRHTPEDMQRDVRDLAMIVREAVTGRRAPAIGADEASLAYPVLLGPLGSVLVRASATDPAEQLDAAGLLSEFLRVARLLPRPDPLAVAVPAGSEPVLALGDAVRPAQQPPAPVRSEGFDERLHRWPGLVLAVLLAVGAVAAGAWAWIATRPETVPVPELAGSDRSAAAGTVAELGWSVQEVLVREPGTSRGEVVRSDPAAGTSLGEGATLRLFVSLGDPLVRLSPLTSEIYGRTVSEAAANLEEGRLVMGGETVVNDEVVPPGLVVGLDVAGGVYELEVGSSVGLLVSAGPADRAVPELPDDRSPIAASDALYLARLRPLEVFEFSAEVPAGEVIGFRPGSGEVVAADSVVEMLVSRGPASAEPEPEPPAEPDEPAEPGATADPEAVPTGGSSQG